MEKLKEEYLYDRDGNTEIRNENNTTLYTPPSGLFFASLNHSKAEPSTLGPTVLPAYQRTCDATPNDATSQDTLALVQLSHSFLYLL